MTPSSTSTPDQTAWVPPLPDPSSSPGGGAGHHDDRLRTPVARDRSRGKLGGVVAGLCASYGFDLRTTRVAVVLGSLVLPGLVAVYGAAWLLLPPDRAQARPLRDVLRDRQRMPLLIAVAAALLITGAGSFGGWFLLGGLPWGAALIALGVLLWALPGLADREAGAPATGGWDPPPPAGAPERGWGPPLPADAPGAPLADAPMRPSTVPPSNVPPSSTAHRRRHPVGTAGTLIALAFVGIGAAGDALGWWNLPILAAVLAVVAILWTAHLLSGIVNRSLLVLPGLLVLGALGVGLLITSPDLDGGVGTERVRPLTAEEAGEHRQLGVGRLTVDLTSVVVAPGTRIEATAEVGVGLLHVLVPAEATLQVRSHVGAGVVVLDGEEISAGVRHDELRSDAPAAGSGDPVEIVLDLDVGAGRIDIERLPVERSSSSPVAP